MAKKKNDLFFQLSIKFEFNGAQRMRFYTKLVQLLENGVSLDTALGQIQSISARKRNSALPKLYKKWRNDVAEGINFGQCLAPYVPSSESILLETGANSGKLIRSLHNAAESIENQSKVKKAIITAGAYPAVLLGMLIAAMLLSAYKVIPTFEEIIPVDRWEGIAYFVAKTAEFIRDQGFFILVTVVSIGLIIAYSMPRWTAKARIKFDRFVPWSLYKMWQGSAFLLSVASLMSAGVKLDEVSLARISRQSDPYLKQRVRAIQKYIASGENLGDSLYNSGYEFPDSEIIGDLQIYAKLRGFDQNLIRVTRVWVDGLVDRVNLVMKTVNFVILVLIAVVIGCLIVSFYSVFQQIQSQQQ
ncbi:MAG: type II secretion system F family protein [Rhodospirillales bacterium]|nr:type II secretion system F family protein [Alphaproteobacteria bacterium]MCB9986582.1 type II secretion system F family protein [Rhodospirillales bacterium]USO06887.1 MAG: type II secretion system F family protein [Rhodospirillales bacterium]